MLEIIINVDQPLTDMHTEINNIDLCWMTSETTYGRNGATPIYRTLKKCQVHHWRDEFVGTDHNIL